MHVSTEFINLVHTPQELHATKRIHQKGLRALRTLLAHPHTALSPKSLKEESLTEAMLFLPGTTHTCWEKTKEKQGKFKTDFCMAAYACNLCSQEVGAGKTGDQGYHQLFKKFSVKWALV